MYTSISSALAISYMLLALFCRNVESGPMKRLSRMVREVYPAIEPDNDGNQAQVCIVGDVVYEMDEPVPAEQPCLKCKCQPPGVQCETIQCAKSSGCKAIHKPNKCCPDYQCQCEHNGKFYANGEKLETPPGGECKVCYCRGGEVQCAEVSCYIRNDCEAKRVPGTCCPKYDNCPPIDPIPERSSYTTEMVPSKSNKEQVDWLITGLSNSTQLVLDSSNDIPDENKILDAHDHETTTSIYKSLEVEDLQRESSKITIQEIIPERKEIPITAPPKVNTESQGTLIIEEADDFSNYSNELLVTDAEAESSEISEVFQQPPPVLRIGDKLLFLKKGEFIAEKDTSTPSSVITIIGAEGLQRGFEESVEVHEIKIDPTEDNQAKEVTGGSERTLESSDSEDLNLLVLNTAASTHILSLVKRKNKPTSTEVFPIEEFTSTTESGVGAETSDAVAGQYIINNNSSEADDLTVTRNIVTTEHYDIISNSTVNSITEKYHQPIGSSKDQHESMTEINPEYPPLKEILGSNMDDSSQRFDMEVKMQMENFTSTESDLKIISGVFEITSNKTVPKNTTHKDWLKVDTETLLNPKAYLPEEILNQPAPIDFEDTGDSVVVLSKTEHPPIDGEAETSFNGEQVKENNESGEVTRDDSAPVEIPGSVETLVEINDDSGESTTPKNSNAPILSEENASVESTKNQSEADDMVGVKEILNESRIEKTTPHDEQMIDNVHAVKNQTYVKNVDVEVIDTTVLQKPTIEKSISSTSNPYFLPISSNAPDTPLKIIKREYSENYEERDEDIDEEDQEKKRDEEIFKQLLEDTSTPKVQRQLEEENSPMKGESSALAQFNLKDAATDSNIIELLSNFFNNQRIP